MQKLLVTVAAVACLGGAGVSAHAADASTGTVARADSSTVALTGGSVAQRTSAALRASATQPAAVRRLRIRTTWLAGAERTRAYQAALAATGGHAPYRWSLSSGSLPRGLVLSRRGVISGKPPAAGAREFTVRVRDARGNVARRALSLAVATRGGVRLTESSIGPVKLPAKPNPALTTLRGSLGTPTRQYAGPGCAKHEPTRERSSSWGGFTAYGVAESDAQIKIDAWSLWAGRVPVRFATPYQVSIGTTVRQVRQRVPGVKLEVEEFLGEFDLWSTETMRWWIDRKTQRVVGIAQNERLC